MLSVFFIFPVRAKNTFGKKKDKVTRLHFYDLNKNGRMDTYENPSAPVEYRVEHLLSQMTLEEKVGQMLTSLGWPMYERVGEDIRLTPQLEKEIGEYHIGSLWGFMRADPFGYSAVSGGRMSAWPHGDWYNSISDFHRSGKYLESGTDPADGTCHCY